MNELDWKCRTELLVTTAGIEKFKTTKVLIVGLGGVGGAAAEQICRAGIGNLTIIDNDIVNPSNINRQIIALNSTVGKPKCEVLAERLRDINPKANIKPLQQFINGKLAMEILHEKYDYVIDAIDTLTPKVELLEACILSKTSVVSSMGSAGRVNPSLVKIDDIKKSNHCKFAYIVRKYLHRKGIYEGIKVVYSTEEVPEHAIVETDGSNHKRTIVGTMSYMPAIFGAFCASVVIRDLLNA
jgi:tRNA threonylcarbamoyladenosine dehydratase